MVVPIEEVQKLFRGIASTGAVDKAIQDLHDFIQSAAGWDITDNSKTLPYDKEKLETAIRSLKNAGVRLPAIPLAEELRGTFDECAVNEIMNRMQQAGCLL